MTGPDSSDTEVVMRRHRAGTLGQSSQELPASQWQTQEGMRDTLGEKDVGLHALALFLLPRVPDTNQRSVPWELAIMINGVKYSQRLLGQN